MTGAAVGGRARDGENKKGFCIETFPIGVQLVPFYPAADRARQCGRGVRSRAAGAPPGYVQRA